MTTLTTGPSAEVPGALPQPCRRCPAARGPSGRSDGFTLLELILVMVIICTVLALAAPSLRGFFASRRTSEAAAQMLALTQLARTVAVSDGVVCRLNVDAQEHTYWLTVQREGVFQSPGTEYGRRFSLPEGTDVALLDPADESPAEYVEFNPNGRISPAIIRLTDQQGSIIEITCPSATESFAVTAVAGR